MLKEVIKNSVAVLVLGAATAVFGQVTTTTTTKATTVVQNPDGSYSVIEYPVGKEVTVNLLPGSDMTGSKGVARVTRSANGTMVNVDLSGVGSNVSSVYAYAVDPTGATTLLGPISVKNGAGQAMFTTPMNRFMLVLSPMEQMSQYDPTSSFYYRSELPKGFAVVPRAITGETNAVATGNSVDASYEVPLLGVPKMNGKTTEVRVNFTGDLQGLDGKAYLKPEGGKTQIKMRFSDMRKVPKDKRFVLWAKGADGSYAKLGQVINTGSRDEGEIRSETAMADFGLLMTVEDADVTSPSGRTYSVFTVPQMP